MSTDVVRVELGRRVGASSWAEWRIIGIEMIARNDLYVGVDLGTSGVRALAIDRRGTEQERASAEIPREAAWRQDEWHEQEAEAWWAATRACLRQLNERLMATGGDSSSVRALAVDATSGTIVPVDRRGQPLARGIMYNDARAVDQAMEFNERGQRRAATVRTTASHPLAKWHWMKRHRPETMRAARYLCHQADFIVGRLTGRFGVSDYSNCLKTGYDPARGEWPEWLADHDEVLSYLPQVVPPGTPLDQISAAVAADLGWARQVLVVAGATDGVAAFLASGATCAGDDNTTYGSTLVFKRLSDVRVDTADGLVYSHRLPGGMWLPGSASNTGCSWIHKDHPTDDLSALDGQAAERLPSPVLAYPLIGEGERFPFACTRARGFLLPKSADPSTAYAARLQGTALVERLGYETLDGIIGRRSNLSSNSSGNVRSELREVYATGGGSRSSVWLQLRADVTGRRVHRPACGESAFGSALLAVVGAHQQDLLATCRELVRLQGSFEPDPLRHAEYQTLYAVWKDALRQRGYLTARTDSTA
jgi:sugar (pentulose or hexulose) kinase